MQFLKAHKSLTGSSRRVTKTFPANKLGKLSIKNSSVLEKKNIFLSRPQNSFSSPKKLNNFHTQKKTTIYTNLQARTHTFMNTENKQRTFRSQKSGLTHLLSRTNKLAFSSNVSQFSIKKNNNNNLNNTIKELSTSPTSSALFTNFAPKKSELNFFKKKKLNTFSPVDHIQKFLNSQQSASFSTKKTIKSSSGQQYTVHEGESEAKEEGEATQPLDQSLRQMYEDPEENPDTEGTVQTAAKVISEICTEELDSLKQGAEFENPRWDEAQKWLEATDYTFIHQEENFAFLVLKEEGELPAVRISWNPTYTPTEIPNDDDDPARDTEEEGEGEEDEDEETKAIQQNEENEDLEEDMEEDVNDQPFEIQIRNPNKIRGGQLVLKAIIGPDDKFYIQQFWVGTGTNLSLDTWLSGSETSKLIYSPIEQYSTDFRHSLYDYLDIIGISDNVSRFIAAHTRINRNVKQREMMVRMLQFMEPIEVDEELTEEERAEKFSEQLE